MECFEGGLSDSVSKTVKLLQKSSALYTKKQSTNTLLNFVAITLKYVGVFSKLSTSIV